MQLKSRHSILHTAVADWKTRGLIDADTAHALDADIGADAPGAGFRGFIILAGIISLCFGVMTFVAANWDDIPRLGRLGLIVGSMWASWAGAILSERRGHPWLAQTLVLLASGIFGAGIMLVAQLYHIQGEPRDAVFLWMLGTALAAVATRSTPALVLALALLGLWGCTTDGLGVADDRINWLFLPLWALGAAAAWWMHSRFAAHVATIALLSWVIFVLLINDTTETAVFVIFLLCWVLIGALLLSAARGWLKGFEGAALVYVLLFLAVLILVYYIALGHARAFERSIEPLLGTPALLYGGMAAAVAATAAIALAARGSAVAYDCALNAGFTALWSGVIFGMHSPLGASAAMLAMAIWVVRMGWRAQERGLRVLGFLGFGGAMLLIYAETIGTLIGTSLFYVGAGVILLAGAWIGTRLKPATLKEKQP